MHFCKHHTCLISYHLKINYSIGSYGTIRTAQNAKAWTSVILSLPHAHSGQSLWLISKIHPVTQSMQEFMCHRKMPDKTAILRPLSRPLITCKETQHKLHIMSQLKQKILIYFTFTQKTAKCEDYKYPVFGQFRGRKGTPDWSLFTRG